MENSPLIPLTEPEARSLLGLEPPEDWHLSAACNGVGRYGNNPFYPPRGGDPSPALVYCRRCPVRLPCLQYALLTKEKYGIWGGMTDNGRQALRRWLRARGYKVPGAGRKRCAYDGVVVPDHLAA